MIGATFALGFPAGPLGHRLELILHRQNEGNVGGECFQLDINKSFIKLGINNIISG